VLTLLAFGASSSDAAAKTWRVELDGDDQQETVTTKKRRCSAPYPCTQLIVRDGDERVALTPVSQRPRYPYHWRVTKVRFRDLTGDGLPEVVWELFTVQFRELEDRRGN